MRKLLTKLIILTGITVFINIANATSIPISQFHFAIHTPATTDDAIKAGMTANVVERFVDTQTGIPYVTMTIDNEEKFCATQYKNGTILTFNEFVTSFLYLLNRDGDNVRNYGWPFSDDDSLKKVAVFSGGDEPGVKVSYGDLGSGGYTEHFFRTDGLVVCKTPI